MLSHFMAPENVVFAWALGLLVALGAAQLIAFFVGAGFFAFLDDYLPDIDADAAASPSGLESVLGLLGLGRVPLVISILLFLFLFSFTGYNLQLVLSLTSVGRLSAGGASLLALLATLPLLRLTTGVVARLLPRDESLAVSEATFVGRFARITLGTVTRERASEARLEDDHGHVHYVQVVADAPGEVFHTGEEVVIVGRDGIRFTVVRGPTGLLED